MTTIVKLASAAVVVLFTRVTAAEPTPMLLLDPAAPPLGSFVEPANNKTWGTLFEVKSPIAVTHLAWYDENRDGLSHPHQVGIWKNNDATSAAESLLVSTTIVAGTVAELSGPWRRVPIPRLILQPGLFSVGGQNHFQSLDDMVYIYTADDRAQSMIDSRIKVLSFDYNVSGLDGFYPPGSGPNGWYLLDGLEVGAMFFLEAVPEPPAGVLGACAGFLVAAAERCCSRRWQVTSRLIA